MNSSRRYCRYPSNRLNTAWRRLGALTEHNAGFQRSRGTASSILPVRAAAAQCASSGKQVAAMFDDLAWAFDCPPRAVIELALHRLGVPGFFIDMLRDLDNMALRDTILAHGCSSEGSGESEAAVPLTA